jgi:hypothetical protein
VDEINTDGSARYPHHANRVTLSATDIRKREKFDNPETDRNISKYFFYCCTVHFDVLCAVQFVTNKLHGTQYTPQLETLITTPLQFVTNYTAHNTHHSLKHLLPHRC